MEGEELTTSRAAISCCTLLFSLPLTYRLCIPLKRISILPHLLFALPLLLELSSSFGNRNLGTFLLGEKFRLQTEPS